LLSSLGIIAYFSRFVKGKNEKSRRSKENLLQGREAEKTSKGF
jgi:hypothetical protein